MGKRFVTRSRQEWEALLILDTQDADQRGSSAIAWLTSRLEGYVQTNLDAPITLAIPDRFLDALGDAPGETLAKAGHRQGEET
jgi:hypothetical protein